MPRPARDDDESGAETPARGAHGSHAEASAGGAHGPGAETPAGGANGPGAETPTQAAHDPGFEIPARDEGRRPARAHTAVASSRKRPAAPGPRAADVLAETIRAAILSGDLAPGAPLREEELSTAHGVSRHTARTALAHLTAEHLATAEPYRGVRVSRLDDDALVALQQLRCALETEALRIVRDRGIRPPDVDAALDDLAAAEAASAWPATLAAHARVHLALVEAAGSPRIAAEYRRLDSEMHLLLTHVRPAYAPGSLTAEHRAYVEQALVDPEHAVRAHLDHSTRAIIDGRRGS